MSFKKILLLLTILSAAISPSGSKAQAFKEEQNSFSGGYGFGTIVGSLLDDFYNNTEYHISYTGPLYFKYEHAVTSKVGFGINIAYAKYAINYTYDNYGSIGGFYTEEDAYTTYSILGRINWHFGSSETFDPYFGFGVGYRNGTYSFKSTDPTGPRTDSYSFPFPFGFETTIGSRYFFSSNVGLYAEFGIAKSVMQLGLTAKF
jgi:hypothetical protein